MLVSDLNLEYHARRIYLQDGATSLIYQRSSDVGSNMSYAFDKKCAHYSQ